MTGRHRPTRRGRREARQGAVRRTQRAPSEPRRSSASTSAAIRLLCRFAVALALLWIAKQAT